jgi:hypothetical protein
MLSNIPKISISSARVLNVFLAMAARSNGKQSFKQVVSVATTCTHAGASFRVVWEGVFKLSLLLKMPHVTSLQHVVNLLLPNIIARA